MWEQSVHSLQVLSYAANLCGYNLYIHYRCCLMLHVYVITQTVQVQCYDAYLCEYSLYKCCAILNVYVVKKHNELSPTQLGHRFFFYLNNKYTYYTSKLILRTKIWFNFLLWPFTFIGRRKRQLIRTFSTIQKAKLIGIT